MAIAKNTRTITNETLTEALTRSQRLRLADVTRKCGLSQETVLRRAVGTWLEVEAPVYLAHAKQA